MGWRKGKIYKYASGKKTTVEKFCEGFVHGNVSSVFIVSSSVVFVQIPMNVLICTILTTAVKILCEHESTNLCFKLPIITYYIIM